ncbi:hypothetical protein ACFU44_12100 [Nocardia rhizosphaerihabitans]|uniref:hypothetical protein n=1 Tax=Nocardia rhizosphaerihabitans TaxID=1691570 RepID=UPI00366B68D3
MNITWVRRAHRWFATAFTATLVLTLIALALSGPEWVSYLPLFPLAGLFLSGSLMFLLLYSTRRRSARNTQSAPQSPATDRPATTHRVRQLHRWSAAGLVITVSATIIALAQREPIVWVAYLPLIPLATLFFSGLYMLTAPRFQARRAATGV